MQRSGETLGAYDVVTRSDGKPWERSAAYARARGLSDRGKRSVYVVRFITINGREHSTGHVHYYRGYRDHVEGDMGQ